MKTKLKLCPFCGAISDIFLSWEEGWYNYGGRELFTKEYYVHCAACSFSGPRSRDALHAVKLWNGKRYTNPAHWAGKGPLSYFDSEEDLND